MPDLRQFDRTRLILGLKIAVILAAVLVLFRQDLAIVAVDALQNESTSYILAIPFLFAYLVYRKRRMLRTVIPLESQGQPGIMRYSGTIAGALLSSTAIELYWYGSHTFTPLEYHMLTLPIFAAGLTLIMFNTQVARQLAFALAFLVLLSPPPSEILNNVGSALSVMSSEASHTLVRLLGMPSTLTSQYGNPVIQVTRSGGETMNFAVGIACSGIYSLLGFLVFAVFIGYIIRDKPWKKFVLFGAGFLLIYALNIARIVAILEIGYNYGADMATELFHLLGGWILIFLGTLLLLAFSEKVLHTQIFSKAQVKCSECSTRSMADHSFCSSCGRILAPAPIKFHEADLAKMAAIIIIPILLISVQAPVFALTRGPPIVLVETPTGQQVSSDILPAFSAYDLRFGYRDEVFEALAQEDMALVYYYVPTNQSQHTVYATIEIASSRQNLYSWETCVQTGRVYPFGHQETKQIELKDVQLMQNPPLIGRFFVFQYTTTNVTQAVLYWFQSSTFAVNSTLQQKNVKISLITYPEKLEDLPSIENQSIALATQVAAYWAPIEPWSQMTLFLSLYSFYFAAATSTLLPVITILYAFEKRRQRKVCERTYGKLSVRNKQIIDAVREAEEIKRPTLHTITVAYQNKTGEPIDEEKLLQILSGIEKTDIIKGCIGNIQDEPTQIWKSALKTSKKPKQKSHKNLLQKLQGFDRFLRWLDRSTRRTSERDS